MFYTSSFRDTGVEWIKRNNLALLVQTQNASGWKNCYTIIIILML